MVLKKTCTAVYSVYTRGFESETNQLIILKKNAFFSFSSFVMTCFDPLNHVLSFSIVFRRKIHGDVSNWSLAIDKTAYPAI